MSEKTLLRRPETVNRISYQNKAQLAKKQGETQKHKTGITEQKQ